MRLITKQLLDASLISKAPTGLMYKINAVHVAITTALAANYLIIADRHLDTPDVSDTLRVGDIVATFATDLQGNFFISDLDVITKWITIGKTNAASMDARVSIYGEFVKGTKTQLIMEWFRKGR